MSKPRDPNRYHLLWRIKDASGLNVAQLARVMDIKPQELEAILRLRRGLVVETDMDDMWTRLDAYVNERIGLYMAIREEISRKRQADVKERLERLARMRKR